MPFAHSPTITLQLSSEVGPPETGCLRLNPKMGNELSQFDIKFMPRPAIKGQALADFIAEFTTPEEKRPKKNPTIMTARIPKWGL